MLFNIPLLIAPLIVYNVFAFGWLGNEITQAGFEPLIRIPMVSGQTCILTLGDLMILVALMLLFIEILKSTRTSVGSIVDHILSTLVFIAYLIEFLLVGRAATSVFFILMFISLIDVIAGYSVTIRGARRDMTYGGPGMHG